MAVCNSLCPVEVENESDKYDLLKYNRDCIFSKCKTYGNANKSIQDVTPAVVNWQRSLHWNRWQNKNKTVNDKLCSAFEKVSAPGNFRGLIEQYRCDVHTIRTHLFHLEWQRMQFGLIIDTLKHGEAVFVIDFARNFTHVSQDEPQSAHWDRMQSTMHPCVAYYKC